MAQITAARSNELFPAKPAAPKVEVLKQKRSSKSAEQLFIVNVNGHYRGFVEKIQDTRTEIHPYKAYMSNGTSRNPVAVGHFWDDKHLKSKWSKTLGPEGHHFGGYFPTRYGGLQAAVNKILFG